MADAIAGGPTDTPDHPLDRVSARRLIPVVVSPGAAIARPLADVLADADLPVLEVTLRSDAALATIAAIAAHGRVTVGAGTVLRAGQVDQAVDAGAAFVVSPGLSAAVAERCVRRGVPYLPGAVTATEVMAALDLGLDVVKFFPAGSSGGPHAIDALRGPFPHVRFVPTGGIGPANLRDYLDLPNVAAVGGSWMIPRDALAVSDYRAISRAVATARTGVVNMPPEPGRA